MAASRAKAADPASKGFILRSPEGVGYYVQPGDPFCGLQEALEGFLPEERLLPLSLLLDPGQDQDRALELNRIRRLQLVAQIQRYGSKLRLEELQRLVSDLRKLVLADFFLEVYSAGKARSDNGTRDSTEGSSGGPGQGDLDPEAGA